MTDSVEIQVKQVIVDVLDIELDPWEIDSRLSLYSATISLDSLTLLHIITRLEQTLHCEIDDEALMSADLVDVGSLVELVLGQLETVRPAIGRAEPVVQGTDN